MKFEDNATKTNKVKSHGVCTAASKELLEAEKSIIMPTKRTYQKKIRK